MARQLTPFQLQALEVGLRKLFNPTGFFDICQVDALLKLTGGQPDPVNYEALRVLHCVHYRDMPPELREQLVPVVVEVLAGPNVQLPALEEIFRPQAQAPTDSPRRGLLARLTS